MATFDYTSRDYISIRQDLITRSARLIPEWDTTDASEFGNVFIDLWAYMGDVLHFYIDRAASETFLDTATQRESVLAIANLMDYSPSSARASRGTCTVRLTDFPSENIKSYTISSASVSGSTVTYTTSANHELTGGQLVTISGMSPSAFNISNVVINSAPTSTTFTLLTSQFTSAPSGSSTAGGTLDYNLEYTVPQYTVFSGYNNEKELIEFYLSSPLTFTNTGVNLVGSLIQGKIISNESLGTSSGRVNQSFTLMKTNVDTDSITVQVYEGPLSGGSPTPVTYQYVPYISTATFSDKVFTTKLTADGYTQIIFGNSFNGFIPTTNAVILASYRTTVGSAGNIGANKIQFVSGEPSQHLSIQSSSVFTGGAEVESIESIRTNVSRLFRTQDRAVSLQDYKDLMLQIPGVSKATATYSSGTVTLYPVPHLSVYPPSPITAGSQKVVIEIPTSMAESINNYFSTRSMLGVTASVVDPSNHGSIDKYIECTPVYVGMQVYIKDNFVQSWIKDEVELAIRSLLSFDKVLFGQTLTVGEVYRAALSVNGVDYVTLTTLDTTYDSTPATVGTVVNVTATNNKLLCFTDEMDYTSPSVTNAPAISLAMYGGITGSN